MSAYCEETCSECGAPIADDEYGDPYGLFDGPLCIWCYQEMVND